MAPLFVGSPMLSCGPTNASAALLVGTFAAVGGTTPETRLALLPALLAMTGGFVLLAAWLRLGGFADFVPRTVIAAIIAAAAIRVFVLQLPFALGIKVDANGSPFEMLAELGQGLSGVLNPDLAVALASLIVFAVTRSRLGLGATILTTIAAGSFFAMVAENVALATGPSLRQGLFAYVGIESATPTALSPGPLVPQLFQPLLPCPSTRGVHRDRGHGQRTCLRSSPGAASQPSPRIARPRCGQPRLRGFRWHACLGLGQPLDAQHCRRRAHRHRLDCDGAHLARTGASRGQPPR